MISVIIPVYHAEKQLPQSLDSWVAQTFPDFEILCVLVEGDDASRSVVEAYAHRYTRIRIVNRRDGHCAGGNRNAGLDASRGNCILFADADDVVEPQLLACMNRYKEEYDADVVCCAFDRRHEKTGRTASTELAHGLDVWESGDDPHAFAFVYTAAWGKLYTREAIGSHRFETGDIVNEDCPFFLSIVPDIRRFVRIPNVLYHYTVSPTSLMTTSCPDKSRRFQQSLCRVRDAYRDNGYDSRYLSMLTLAAFIHVGIADMHRLAENPAVDACRAFTEAREFLDREFPGWRQLPLKPCDRLTLRGAAVYASVLLYKMHLFLPFIAAYNTFSHLTGRILKW